VRAGIVRRPLPCQHPYMRVILAMFCLTAASPALAAPCLHYEPAVVTLSGTIEKHVAFGPPGFGETPKIDAREDYTGLRLDRPLCTIPSGEDQPGETIRMLQMVFLRPKAGASDRLSGDCAGYAGAPLHRPSSHGCPDTGVGFRIAVIRRRSGRPARRVDATVTLASCPASYRLADGRYLFIPFAPSNQTPAYWAEVQQKSAARGIRLAFVPDLLNFEQTAAQWAPISAGLTFWGHKDLLQASSAATVAAEHKAAALGPFWMQPIAIQDARPAASVYWEAENTLLLRTLWSQALQAKYPYTHLITWNDYGETTQFAPSSGSQFVFYDLTAYYIEQFKTGRPPAITADAIYYTYRDEIFDPGRPAAAGDKPFNHPGATPVTNDVEMVAMMRAPGTIRIQLSGQTVSANVGGGLQVLRMPARPGTPSFQILRDGKPVVQTAGAWPIVAQADKATPDYFGGSSTRAHE
jgi:hypothetical protein